MLATLAVRNFALIDRLELEFVSGLNGLTGETGAGKSIVIDALSMLLGARAGSDVIRTGTDTAFVEGLFQVNPAGQPELLSALAAAGIDESEMGDEIVLSREISRLGRNRCRVNGRLVPVLALAAVGECLVDLHGQHEHQSLLKIEKHRDLLDAFGGRQLLATRAEVESLYHEYRHVRARLKELRGNEAERARRVDMLRYQLEEIQAAKLQPGEEEELARERVLLQNAERLVEQAGQARLYLRGPGETGGTEEDPGYSAAPRRGARMSFTDPGSGAIALLGEAASLVEELSGLDGTLAETAELLRNAEIQAGEAARALGTYLEHLQFEPGRLDKVEARLNRIKELERKYGPDIPAVLEYARAAARELAELESPEQSVDALAATLVELEKRLAESVRRLSARRRECARLLEERVQGHLADLNMQAAVFVVDVRSVTDDEGVEVDGRRVRVGPSGMDNVEFLLSANPGEPPRPLTKVASGGELSRVMLALKTALSEVDRVGTLIFDEIDAGIGGRTAQAVAEKLYQVSCHRQVILVTHLPQIACLADRHFVIEKHEDGGRTHTDIRVADGDDRVLELARMLGGVEVTATTLRHAREMMTLARKVKERGDPGGPSEHGARRRA